MAKVPLWKIGELITVSKINAMVKAINAAVGISVAAPLTMRTVKDAGIVLGIKGFPQFDIVQLQEDLLAGKYDKKCLRVERDYDASGSDEDQWTTDVGDPELQHAMDAWRTVFLQGHRTLAMWHGGAGQRLPLLGFNQHIVETTGAISSGGSGTGKILTPLSGSLADTDGPLTLPINDIGTGTTTPSGARCVVFQHNVGGKWWIVPAVGATSAAAGLGEVEFTVDSTFAYGAGTFDATVTLTRGNVGTIEATDSIEIDNPPGTVNATWFKGEEGWTGWGTYDPDTGRVRARGLECGPTE